MKFKSMKKVVAGLLASVMVLGSLAGCGEKEAPKTEETGTEAGTQAGAQEGGEEAPEAGGEETPAPAAGGKILWLTTTTSGIQYDATLAYAEAFCAANGYTFEVVKGDDFNDPAANLAAIQPYLTDEVVGLVSGQDGGLKDIMDAAPELKVVGHNSDMNYVFGAEAQYADLVNNPNFLGTIADGKCDGADLGQQMFDAVVEKGYKRISYIAFPAFAFPNQGAAMEKFMALVEEHNATAAEKIEVVGEPKVLDDFAPITAEYFLDAQYQNLDAIVATVHGFNMVYAALSEAIANGTVTTPTKLVTSGYTDDPTLQAAIGGDGIVQYVTVSPVENMGYALTLLDRAIKGTMFEDFAVERVDSLEYVIDSQEDVANLNANSLFSTADVSKAQITIDELNAVASFADLKALFMSDQLTVDALAK